MQARPGNILRCPAFNTPGDLIVADHYALLREWFFAPIHSPTPFVKGDRVTLSDPDGDSFTDVPGLVVQSVQECQSPGFPSSYRVLVVNPNGPRCIEAAERFFSPTPVAAGERDTPAGDGLIDLDKAKPVSTRTRST